MAPFGKLYSYMGSPRSTAIFAVAKANNIELEIVDTSPAKGLSPEYLKINKLGKVPTFVGADGYILHECIAIAVYLASQNKKTTLLGKTKQDYATVLSWMSFFNTEVLIPFRGWIRPLLGRAPYDKKNVEDSSKVVLKALDVAEQHLVHNTYLAGDRITLADFFAAGSISHCFKFFFDKTWRAQNPNITRWYINVNNEPIYSAVADKFFFIDEAIKNQPPKKPEQPKKEAPPQATPKPEAKEVEDDKKDEAICHMCQLRDFWRC